MAELTIFDPQNITSFESDPQSMISTKTISAISVAIKKAYEGVNEIDDILINLLSNRINVRVVLKARYANHLLENLINRQLVIYDNPDSNSFFFNFDYAVKDSFEPNDSEVSILS